MQKLEKVIYEAHATATGGRDGFAETPDRLLSVKLNPPKEMGGSGQGVNPEQLFAAGYAACFIGALKFVASQQKINLSADTRIHSKVGIGPIPNGFGISVAMEISIPQLDRAQAEKLIHDAHIVCPYSNATRGNIVVDLKLV